MGISEEEWGQVYAKAWADEAFRNLLETDPTAALKKFADEAGKQWGSLLTVPPNPDADSESPASSAGNEKNCIHLVSCC